MTPPPLRESLLDALAAARTRVAAVDTAPALDYFGTVERVGDGVATLVGLAALKLYELVRFEDGTIGIALTIERDRAACVLLGAGHGISAGGKAFGTGTVAATPVGEGLLGRVVDPLGAPLDGGAPIVAASREPIERPAPAIVDRELITEPLMTGLTVIDAMIPLGRGQRELVIGDRKTGKTAIAIDTIINQRRSDVICIYCAVGQKSSTVAQVIDAVRSHGAIERCIFVVGEADAPPGMQWIAPYAACTMAEYFRDRGQHALLIVDDMTKHAIVYRQLSLLLRNPPGREAYPGDIFYIHSRLLERAAKLSAERGGGSLTALPIAETQAGDLTAYIPTNLISITDGQIFLEPKLFYEGQKPAVNVGLSVSRVGGKTQAPAMKALAGELRLAYAQFLELEVFTRFGSMMDARTQKTIEHGKRIRAVLAQPQMQPRSLTEQVALLLAVREGKLDAVPLDRVETFKAGLGAGLADRCPQAVARLEANGRLGDDDRTALLRAIDDRLASLAAPAGAG
ncbi:MAG: F0F1 ATP synthase subunit alpha [Rhodospirillaceae bacterium]|nr:F0F1 ATP synthase subunit alpha [Rhodospirillaceae bacterium]